MNFGESLVSAGGDPAQGLNTGLRNRRSDNFLKERNRALEHQDQLALDKNDGQPDAFASPDERDYYFRVQRFVEETMDNPVRRALLRRDRTIKIEDIGTLARYNFDFYGMPIGFEGNEASPLSRLLRKGLEGIDNGVGTLLLRTFSLYISVAVFYTLFFVTFARIGNYVAALGVSQAVGVLELIIGIVFQKLILSALWSFSGEPRTMADTFNELRRIVDGVAFRLNLILKTKRGKEAEQIREDAQCLIAAYAHLAMQVIPVYSSLASGDVSAQTYFKYSQCKLKRKIANLQWIDDGIKLAWAAQIDGLIYRQMNDSVFYLIFHYVSVILTHFDIVLGGYLFFVVPIQIWDAVGLMINIVYPIMMHFLYTLREEENLLGSPFLWNIGIGQRTRYIDWEQAFLTDVERITQQCYGPLCDIYAAAPACGA